MIKKLKKIGTIVFYIVVVLFIFGLIYVYFYEDKNNKPSDLDFYESIDYSLSFYDNLEQLEQEISNYSKRYSDYMYLDCVAIRFNITNEVQHISQLYFGYNALYKEQYGQIQFIYDMEEQMILGASGTFGDDKNDLLFEEKDSLKRAMQNYTFYMDLAEEKIRELCGSDKEIQGYLRLKHNGIVATTNDFELIFDFEKNSFYLYEEDDDY